MTTDEEFMGRWFSKVTKPQLARYNQRMADAAPYRNSPRWERERVAAQNEFHINVAEARALYEQAMNDLMSAGEVSEATDELLTRFQNVELVQMAAK